MRMYNRTLGAYLDGDMLSPDNLEPSMPLIDRIGGYARGLGKRWKEGLILGTTGAIVAGCASGPEFLKWDYGNVIRKTPYVVSADGTMTWWELTDGGCSELTDTGCLKYWIFHGDRLGTKKDKFAAYGYRKPPVNPPVKLLEISDGVARNIAEGIAGKN